MKTAEFRLVQLRQPCIAYRDFVTPNADSASSAQLAAYTAKIISSAGRMISARAKQHTISAGSAAINTQVDFIQHIVSIRNNVYAASSVIIDPYA
jgi:hypothetical protein